MKISNIVDVVQAETAHFLFSRTLWIVTKRPVVEWPKRGALSELLDREQRGTTGAWLNYLTRGCVRLRKKQQR